MVRQCPALPAVQETELREGVACGRGALCGKARPALSILATHEQAGRESQFLPGILAANLLLPLGWKHDRVMPEQQPWPLGHSQSHPGQTEGQGRPKADRGHLGGGQPRESWAQSMWEDSRRCCLERSSL